MTELVDRTIAALRTNHDILVSTVPELSEEQLDGPSGASEWSIAQVLSHLGSGAEIMLGPIGAGIAGTPAPEQDNQAIWDRWNASSAREQAEGFLEHDTVLLQAVEALDDEQRASVTVDLGFLPEPVPLVTALGMRLNEVAQHAWDVRVGLDPEAVLEEASAEVLAEQFTGPLSFMLGFTGKADALADPATVAIGDYALVVGDGVALTSSDVNPTATFTGPLEAAIRLVGGRLTPQHTQGDIAVTGSVSLEDLRRVFPGY